MHTLNATTKERERERKREREREKEKERGETTNIVYCLS